jgi:N-formylglutamate amidohydrolase
MRPAQTASSVVFASPHSGRAYSREFLSRTVLDQRSVRSSEDAFVDILFDSAPAAGAPILISDVPRAYVDLNRAADELDPALIDGVRRAIHNPRVSSGLGVVPRVVANGRAIYRGKLSLDEADGRIQNCWRPYHSTLQALLDEARMTFGEAILVDCHSMPHEAIEHARGPGGRRPDVVLGDRFGAAASAEVVEAIEAAFAGEGLVVARNSPFAGAYVTQHYGRPSRQQHVVQVEIDRALYMNESDVRPSPDFPAFKAMIDRVVAEIAEVGRPALPMAAE